MASTDGLQVDEERMNDLKADPDSQGLEALPAERSIGHGATAPQTLPGAEKEAVATYDNSADEQINDLGNIPKPPPQSRFRRRRKLWLFLASLILIAIIVIAITVPLTTRHEKKSHLSKSSSSNETSPTTSSSSNDTFPTTGAFNGTRFATFNRENDSFPTNTLFYQDYAGQLRHLQKSGQDPNFTWSGGAGSPAMKLPSLAQNATPLTCVNYTDPGTKINTAHLFYLNQSNHLQEIVSTDDLSTWSPGPMAKSEYQASATSVSMAALYSAQWFGTVKNNSAGLRLYYGGLNNQVQELAYALGGDSWALQSILNDTNGNAGICARSINPDGFAHLYVLNSENQLVVWSGYFASKAGPSFPTYGYWYANQIFTYNLSPNSSLAYVLGHVSFQDQNNNIQMVESYPTPSRQWGNVAAVGSNNQGVHALPGAGIGAGSIFLGNGEATNGQSDPNVLDVFVQVNGSTVMECLDRNGQFTCTAVPKL